MRRTHTCALCGAPPAELREAQDVGRDGQGLRRVLLPLVVHLLQVLQLRDRVHSLRHVLRCGSPSPLKGHLAYGLLDSCLTPPLLRCWAHGSSALHPGTCKASDYNDTGEAYWTSTFQKYKQANYT